MISGFGGSSTDPDITLRAYEIAADGCSDDAIQRTAGLFIRGEVKEHKAHRLPTTAEFGKECRSNHSAIEAAKNRKPMLPKGEDEYTAQPTPEGRARMLGLIATWRKAWAGDQRSISELIDRGYWKP